MSDYSLDYSIAIRDFQEARRRAALQEVMARLTRRSIDLLPFEEVRRRLQAESSSVKGLQEIPLDSIVGSVGRYSDFTRTFLPRQEADRDRWARVKAAVSGMRGLPPISVYQIGEAYFVGDGHHRVSVARQLGARTIEAYVTEIQTLVPLSPDDEPEDVILKAEYADFLRNTELDRSRPDADISVTEPGRYSLLEEHIQVHRYFMGLEQERDIPFPEAAAHWYDEVYLPVVRPIRRLGILLDFPERTEADLYLWISEHRAVLEESLGWTVAPEVAASDLAARRAGRLSRIAAGVGEGLRRLFLPRELEPGPAAGAWRRERLNTRLEDRLFQDVLVAVSGSEASWRAVDQALVVAGREPSQLLGLHIVSQAASDTRVLEQSFLERAEAARAQAQFAQAEGEVAEVICERARWADLVVASLSHPPGSDPTARLVSGFRTLIQRCPRPVLAVPDAATNLGHALLAYDASPKAEEALYIAAYAASRWSMELTVLTVPEGSGEMPWAQARARRYLERHAIRAQYLAPHLPVAKAILEVAEGEDCDWILLGGYAGPPVVEVVLGSTVDQVLREANLPMLICR